MSKSNLFKIAGLIAFVTIISKGMGFFRDIIIAQTYGASLISDAYFYAYQIPALALILLGGLGGPFNTATISIFSKLIPDLSKKPSEETQKLFNSFLTITSIGFLVIAVLAFFNAELIINLIAWSATPELKSLASDFLQIMSPVLLIGGVIGIFYGIANVYQKFVVSAISPIVLSSCIIIAVLFTGGKFGGVTLAWATLFGAIGQLLVQIPACLKSGIKINPNFNFNNKQLKKLGEVLFPAMLGTTIGQVNVYIDMFFASQLPVGSWSAVGYANRLYQLPVGIMITAFLVPLFPMFSNFVGKQDFETLKQYFKKGLLTLWIIAFPIFGYILVFAQDGIAILFERGQFDANDTALVTSALIFLSIGMVPYVARDTLTRIFYAFEDAKTPFYIGAASITVKFIMNYIFVKPLGVAGITLSTAAVTVFNMSMLAIFIRKKIDLNLKELIKPTLKILTSMIIAIIMISWLNTYANMLCEGNDLYLFIKLIVLGIVYLGIYFGACIVFRVDYIKDFFEKTKKLILKK